MSSRKDSPYSNKAEAFEAFDDIPTHAIDTATIGDVIQQRFGRRDVLKGALAVTTVSYLLGGAASTASATSGGVSSAFDFKELQTVYFDRFLLLEALGIIERNTYVRILSK